MRPAHQPRNLDAEGDLRPISGIYRCTRRPGFHLSDGQPGLYRADWATATNRPAAARRHHRKAYQGFLDMLDDAVRNGRPCVGKATSIVLERVTGQHDQRYVDFVLQPIVDIA